MDLIQIQYALAVARSLNFTKAAECLHTTQPTVSKRIADLENDLQVKLFVRTKQNVSLTPVGLLLCEEFKEIVKRVDSAKDIARGASEGSIGKLHIGLHGLMDLHRIIPHFFEDFIKQRPHIQLVIDSYSFKDLRTLLLSGDLDLIFTFSFEQKGNKDINRLILSRSNTRMYFSRSLLPELNSPPTFQDFKNENLILLQEEESPNAHEHAMRICARMDYTPPKIVTVNTLEAMLLYLESGVGISFLGSSYRMVPSEKLSFIEFDDEDLRVGTDALWKKSNKNPSLGIFVESIVNHAQTLNM